VGSLAIRMARLSSCGPVAASARSPMRWQSCGPRSEIRTSQDVWEESWRAVVGSGEAEATREKNGRCSSKDWM
jgi:hypothetical protein